MTIYRTNDSEFVIEEDVWGCIVAAHPHGATKTYIAQEFDIKTGVSTSGGSFKVSFEDDDLLVKTIFSDLDEVWIGAQKGDYETNFNGTHGRKWLVGGYILKRYTDFQRDGRRTFFLEGLDYMCLMKYIIFGVPDAKKEYKAVDIGQIADDIATLLSAYGFSKAPGDNFVTSTGTKISRTYDKFNRVSEILKDLIERPLNRYDWKISHDMKIYFHQRGKDSTGLTIDWSVLRNGKIIWGDSEDVVTNVWATDAESKCMPPDTLAWTYTKWDWFPQNNDYDVYGNPTVYDITDYIYGREGIPGHIHVLRDWIWSKASETWGIYISGRGEPPHVTTMSMEYPFTWDLNADLRNYTDFCFDLRFFPWIDGATWVDVYLKTKSPSGTEIGWIYRNLDSAFLTEDVEDWKHFTLKLPIVDIDGTILDWSGWSGWMAYDPTSIDRIHFTWRKSDSSFVGYGGIARVYFLRACYVEAKSGLYSPPRTIVVVDKDLINLYDAKERAEYELSLLKYPLQYVNPIVDGDPRYVAGEKVALNLVYPFQAQTPVINEVKHILSPDLDFYSTLSLSEIAYRPPSQIVEGGKTGYGMSLNELLNRVGRGAIGSPDWTMPK